MAAKDPKYLLSGSSECPSMQCSDEEVISSHLPDRSKRSSATSGMTSSSSKGPVTEKIAKRMVRSSNSVPMKCDSQVSIPSSIDLKVDTSLGHAKRVERRMQTDLLKFRGCWIEDGQDGTEQMKQADNEMDLQKRLKKRNQSEETPVKSTHSPNGSVESGNSENSDVPGMKISDYSPMSALSRSRFSGVIPCADDVVETWTGNTDADSPSAQMQASAATHSTQEDPQDLQRLDIFSSPGGRKDRQRETRTSADNDSDGGPQRAVAPISRQQNLSTQDSTDTDSEGAAFANDMERSAIEHQALKSRKVSQRPTGPIEKRSKSEQSLTITADNRENRPNRQLQPEDHRASASKPAKTEGHSTSTPDTTKEHRKKAGGATKKKESGSGHRKS